MFQNNLSDSNSAIVLFWNMKLNCCTEKKTKEKLALNPVQ